MSLTAEIGGDASAVLDLEFVASEPYTRFVFSTVDQALALRQYLFERNLCEFSPPYLRILREEGCVVGMLALLTGTELASCRLRAALAITKTGILATDSTVAARLQLAGRTLLKLRPDDCYISRIATLQAVRGRGLGRLMLRAAVREARERECARLALEVAPQSRAAVQFYFREGFQQVDARQVSDPASGRRLEYLHLARVLDTSVHPPQL